MTTPEEKQFASTRDGFGEGILLAGKNKHVVVLTADLAESTRVLDFAKKFPDQFVEVGVAEQNLVTVAAGLAAVGKIPFVTSYAVFSPGRNWEQIRTTICYNNVPVKIVGSHAGLTTGEDGATHQALEDIALMRTIPNMTVVYPADAEEASQATQALAKTPTPAYLRLDREKSPVGMKRKMPFQLGKADVVVPGSDVTLVSSGPLLFEALLALKELRQQNIRCEIINLHTIKPLDAKTLLQSVRKTGALVTIENHQRAGGVGSAVAEMLVEQCPTPQEFIAVQDTFGESGASGELMEKYGLTAKHIMRAVNKVISRKKK